MKWIRDEEFIRDKIPMTKFEIRVITMAMLDLAGEDTLLDVGAGTGSIAIQAACLGAKVTVIEREKEAFDLIKKNQEKFQVTLNGIHGEAPEALQSLGQFDRVFIGGSKGKLNRIVYDVHCKLRSGGRLVANFIKTDNMSKFKEILRNLRYRDLECRLIQSSKEDHIGLLKAQNPVWIVGGTKQ